MQTWRFYINLISKSEEKSNNLPLCVLSMGELSEKALEILFEHDQTDCIDLYNKVFEDSEERDQYE